jgi:transcriptional regulator GlxA family with amidase domain
MTEKPPLDNRLDPNAPGPTLDTGLTTAPVATQKEDHPFYRELEQSHQQMMSEMEHSSMDMAKEDARETIAVLLYDGLTLMDAIGPMQSLSTLNDYNVITVAKNKGEVTSGSGTKIVADYSLEEVTNPYMIVVPGGLFGTVLASKDAETLGWIRKVDKTTQYTTSVCTGSSILAAAGVLKGKNASTHWSSKEDLERLGAKYTGERYTIDGKYITSAGISAGIDMGLMLVGKIKGDDAAKYAQLTMEYNPEPPYNSGSPKTADPELVKLLESMTRDYMKAAETMQGT